MKKVVMLALLVLGTAAFATNAKPTVVKGTAKKEISLRKHRKHAKKAKKVEAAQTSSTTK
ncbi:MAG TPA: hypothetical protein PKN96_07255 [Flavobacterium sp.]|uniref:hypothetical protein n=1 Tax=Flavobacterium sp. TaxID=239 RepID=UPI002C29B41E|nr:hypothetical protein [Flavobacterium sp.]HNP33073.1 hypothetical protein [Flavobacterium sp.]